MEICYLINQIYKDGPLVRAPFLGDPVVSGIDEKRLSKKKWLVKERNFRGVTINDLKDHLIAIMKKESDNIIIHVEIIDPTSKTSRWILDGLLQLKNFMLRILIGKKHRQIKLQRLEKVQYGRLDCWYIKSINYKRFLNWNKTFKKIK